MPKLTFVIPYYDTDQNLYEQVKETVGAEIEILIFDERLFQSEQTELKAVKADFDVHISSVAHRNRAALFNDALKLAQSPAICLLPPDIFPEKTMADEIQNAMLKGDAAIMYTDYYEEEGDNRKEIKLWEYQNNIDERFDLGLMRIYCRETALQAGGFNRDLEYAEEYDYRLRLLKKQAVKHIAKPLYRSIIRDVKPADPVLSKLNSPGAGAKGGFSYLFYTPEMERETEIVFKDFLREYGCSLHHEPKRAQTEEDEKYEVAVSIVIPILDRKRFIKHTVQTVLDGTWDDFEVIIVDNGSTDGTQDEVRSIQDPRVRLIQHDGKCIAEALNRGIQDARGKYIAQLDSDDEYVPETLATMVAHMETHPFCGLAISYYDLIDIDSHKIDEMGVIKHLEFDRNNILRVDGGGALRFFRKKVLQEFGLYNVDDYGNFGEDYDMVLKISERYDVDRVHDVLYRYRRHEDNTDVQRPAAMKVYNKNNARQDALKRRLEINRGMA